MTEEQERAAFEAWVRSAYRGIETMTEYHLWQGWQGRASLPSNPEHDTYGAPPVGALTSAAEQFVAWHKDGSDALTSGMLDYFAEIFGEALAAAPAPESSGCRWPWLKCGAPAPCDVCGDAAPAPALIGRAAIVEAWNDLPEEIRQCPDLAKLLDALRDCDDAPAPSEAVKGVSDRSDREWFEFCRPYVYLNGSHEMPNYAAICKAVLALASPAVKGVSTAEPVIDALQGIMRDVCEAEEDDPESPDTLCISTDHLHCIVEARLNELAESLAAPSHPPATEDHDHEWRAHPVTKAMICRYCGIDRSPAVAVQAEPIITEAEAAKSGERIAWLRERLDTPEKRRNWRAAQAAAHPKPAAPATADEAVSDEAQSSYRKLCKHGQSRRCFDCERESK